MEQIRAQVEGMLPEPADGGYSHKLLVQVADATTKALDSLFGVKAEVDAGPPPESGGTTMGPLPVSLMVPVALLCTEVERLGVGEYGCDIPSLVDDGALRLLLAKLKKMASDGKVKAAIKGDAPKEKGPPKKEAKAKAEPEMDDHDDLGEDAPPKAPPKTSGAYM
jgi:hypothetical protein